MKLGVCAQVFYNLPLPKALAIARDLGIEAIELPVHRRNPFVDLETCLAGGQRALEQMLNQHGVAISALSVHQEGQLLLGPHGEDTDGIFKGTATEKTAFAAQRMIATAELARRLGIKVVCGFTGCESWPRWFPWPLPDGYERMASRFRDRLFPILDAFAERGITFAHECHPNQFAYNLETAQYALECVNQHPALGFNFDPANLALAGMDPVHFVAELGARICHVHAKDAERVKHRVGRSGTLAHGRWERPDRGFRFRVPGWGELDWRRLISELQIAGFCGVVAIEHEDPTMSRLEGLRQAVGFLEPLLLQEPMEPPWW